MLAALFTTILPSSFARIRRQSAAEKYALYLSQQAADLHFGSLCLALGVLETVDTPTDHAEWLLRIVEASDKCAAAVEDCISKSE
jgi:hypothetical protein